jgi:hypothetical protein
MEGAAMSQQQNYDSSRREFFKSVGKLAYVAPVLLTLHATPSFAHQGSCEPGENPEDCDDGGGGGNN